MQRFLSVSLVVLAITTSILTPFMVAPATASADACRFVLGFKVIHDALPDTVGNCLDNEAYDDSGAVQHTSKGLMAWRSADNFTAFTDGYRSWVNGPYGIKERLNTERYSWEAYDPMLLALQLTDMPPGYSQSPAGARYTSNAWSAGQAKDPQKLLALLQQWGRTNGYRSSFGQYNAAGLKGTLFIFDDVDVFKNADGAHSAYIMEQTGAVGEPKVTQISVPAIGDEATAYQTTIDVGEGDKKVSMTAFGVVFRRGHVLVTVTTGAFSDVATVDDLVNFAKIIDKRAKEYPIKQ